MRLPRIGVAAIIALAAGHAMSGEMYKCVGANGKVEYRDKPCEGGAAGVKITPSENTVGTGEGIESVRAKDAALRARQDARRAAADKDAADARAAQENAYLQARAYQDSVDRANAIREASSQRAADDYQRSRAYQDSVDRANAIREAASRRAAQDNDPQHYRPPASVPAGIKPTPVKPKPPQSIPAYPIAQPAGSPGRRGDN
jgi:hypothetical protein